MEKGNGIRKWNKEMEWKIEKVCIHPKNYYNFVCFGK